MKNRKIQSFVFGIFLISSKCVFAKNKTMHFEPELVELEGILVRQTFPGLPNYESIANGDRAERGWYLRLNKPVDVIEKDGSPEPADRENNVTIMQLVVMKEKDEKLLRKTPSNTKLIVLGKLFPRQTAHHHSRVLIEIQNLVLR